MKKIIVTFALAVAFSAVAFGPVGSRTRIMHRPSRRVVHVTPPRPSQPSMHHRQHMHHHYHYNPLLPFTVGLGTGLFFGRAARPLPPPPPVVAVNPVWVQPVYETRPVLDQFGNIIRYEQVLIKVGYWEYH